MSNKTKPTEYTDSEEAAKRINENIRALEIDTLEIYKTVVAMQVLLGTELEITREMNRDWRHSLVTQCIKVIGQLNGDGINIDIVDAKKQNLH